MFGIISAGAAGLGSIAQGIMGASQMSKARKGLQDFRRQELENVGRATSISTIGAEFQAEQTAINTGTMTHSLQQAGARGVMGGMQGVQEGVNKSMQDIRKDLNLQEIAKQRLIAEDEARIRAMQEERDNADLAGLGQQLAVGQQNLFGGIVGLGQSLGNMGGAIGNQQDLKGTQTAGGGSGGGGIDLMGLAMKFLSGGIAG